MNTVTQTPYTQTPQNQSGFGALLRTWRQRRKRSQLDVSLDAGVSQRHLSFLESGRAKPSREMVLQLASVLEIPLREQNLLLNSAGFSAHFASRPLDSAAMSAVKQALDLTLQHHEPYPAVVVDRHWNLLLQNTAAERFMGLLGPMDQLWQRIHPEAVPNVMRLTFSPQGLQPLIVNWPEVAGMLLSRLQREVSAYPDQTELAQLFSDLINLPSVPERWQGLLSMNPALNASPDSSLQPPEPILPLALRFNGTSLRIFSMISTFGTALDITADELRVETFFPADEGSARFFRALQST
ncbi:helix-turn-helix domain-containing protein [Ketobacter sp.]|uniref:helix-turn-helix domain-containing protein n=1 Tax=Ketobacter sp. TaxID=2083498 RepID=UPI000F1FB037|nr:helix-turn-helix transcriptional regulator [Ketobacter sp.]RLT96794.1 MAG: XRE family transcriptional regulator [Ketobacter sp.]